MLKCALSLACGFIVDLTVDAFFFGLRALVLAGHAIAGMVENTVDILLPRAVIIIVLYIRVICHLEI